MAELVDAHVSGACVERHAGSSPVLGTLLLKKGESSHAEIAQLVEHNLAKVRVASSSLVFRSILRMSGGDKTTFYSVNNAPPVG